MRYPRELRSDPQSIATQVLVPTPGDTMIPLGQLAKIKLVQGPPSIRTENTLLSAYIFVDIRDRDIGGYIADAQQAVREQVQFPHGYYATWSGQFEYMQRAVEKLKVVVPLTIFLVFVLVYLNFGRLTETLIVMLSVPFSLVGGIWLMYWLDYNLSVAAVVGFIGLVGIAAESGMVMLTFLDQALDAITTKRKAAGEKVAIKDLYEAVVQGAVYRIRPVMMTISGSVIGLLPVMLSTGTGSEVMRRIAAPMVGGMVSATILTLIIFPAIYALSKEIPIRRSLKTGKI
jgi:Cu(I)/Ag(I) efflux system membrane protein CusA/SilA